VPVAEAILLVVAALGILFFLWSPSWLGPREEQGPTDKRR
jgi:hypothetical protein